MNKENISEPISNDLNLKCNPKLKSINMKDIQKKTTAPFPQKANEQLDKFPGYPQYPDKEDIYNKFDKEFDIDPEDISKKKNRISVDTSTELNEKDFNDDQTGEDLDIPGSELDNQQETIGSEDEENNYYSIGGDDHNNLDEDKG